MTFNRHRGNPSNEALSDGQFVQRFLNARDGADWAAFTELVERHGPMVVGVCW